jgi:enoyl-CoA hydratase/carnithine racemase
MAAMEYELDEHVAILTMNSGENRFNFDFYDAILQVFDEIENNT